MKLKELDYRFYYIYNKSNKPAITVCVGTKDHKIYSRGISIYSIEDEKSCIGKNNYFKFPCVKKIGRSFAQKMMLKANGTKKSGFPIKNKNGYAQITNCIHNEKYSEEDIFYLRRFEYKSQYNIDLTGFEKKLFTVRTKK